MLVESVMVSLHTFLCNNYKNSDSARNWLTLRFSKIRAVSSPKFIFSNQLRRLRAAGISWTSICNSYVHDSIRVQSEDDENTFESRSLRGKNIYCEHTLH